VRAARLAQLRAAVETLLDRESTNFTELSVADICAQARISRPTFYAYFSDKADLVRALAADTISEVVGASWLTGVPATRADLQRSMSAMCAAYAPYRKVMAVAAEVAAYDTELSDQFTTAVEEAAKRVAVHIEDGQRDGVVRGELNAKNTARWLSWMTESGLRHAFAHSDNADPADVAALTDVHWFTLYDGVR
jgi:AcrR family transcriptional regulator